MGLQVETVSMVELEELLKQHLEIKRLKLVTELEAVLEPEAVLDAEAGLVAVLEAELKVMVKLAELKSVSVVAILEAEVVEEKFEIKQKAENKFEAGIAAVALEMEWNVNLMIVEVFVAKLTKMKCFAEKLDEKAVNCDDQCLIKVPM